MGEEAGTHPLPALSVLLAGLERLELGRECLRVSSRLADVEAREKTAQPSGRAVRWSCQESLALEHGRAGKLPHSAVGLVAEPARLERRLLSNVRHDLVAHDNARHCCRARSMRAAQLGSSVIRLVGCHPEVSPIAAGPLMPPKMTTISPNASPSSHIRCKMPYSGVVDSDDLPRRNAENSPLTSARSSGVIGFTGLGLKSGMAWTGGESVSLTGLTFHAAASSS